MQTIYRNTYTTDFTVIKNDILNSELSGLAKAVLIYLLSKPPHWRLRATDIKRFLKVGINKVYRLLQELREAGYIVMTRVQSAVHWFVYDAPQDKVETATTRAVIDRDGFHHDGSSDDIVNTERAVNTEKPQQRPPISEPITEPEKPNVVVQEKIDKNPVVDVIEDQAEIPHIQDQHQITARRSLRTLTKAEADSVVCAFTLAMSKGTVQNPIGYLLQLVKACKDGSFSPVAPAQAAPTMTASERIRRERERQEEAQARGRMDNETYFAWLSRQYGNTTTDNMKPAGRIGLRKALGWA